MHWLAHCRQTKHSEGFIYGAIIWKPLPARYSYQRSLLKWSSIRGGARDYPTGGANTSE